MTRRDLLKTMTAPLASGAVGLRLQLPTRDCPIAPAYWVQTYYQKSSATGRFVRVNRVSTWVNGPHRLGAEAYQEYSIEWPGSVADLVTRLNAEMRAIGAPLLSRSIRGPVINTRL